MFCALYLPFYADESFRNVPYWCLTALCDARFPDTLLGSDEIEYFYDDASGEYFFDRNPEVFRRLLTYYRSGRLHFPRGECVAEFNDELAFFGIRPTEAVPECCAVSTVTAFWLTFRSSLFVSGTYIVAKSYVKGRWQYRWIGRWRVSISCRLNSKHELNWSRFLATARLKEMH